MRFFAILLALSAGLMTCSRDEFKRERKGDGAEADALKDGLENKSPPPLVVENWLNTEGNPLRLNDLKGKVVLLDFWGVWCGPCRAAMPHLKELHEKHKDHGLVVIGVHTTNQSEKMADFVTQEKLPWPIAADVSEQTVKAFHVDSFPDYYLIDRAGNLRFADLANKEVDRAVELLLKEKPPE